jgi:hypothetical protein
MGCAAGRSSIYRLKKILCPRPWPVLPGAQLRLCLRPAFAPIKPRPLVRGRLPGESYTPPWLTETMHRIGGFTTDLLPPLIFFNLRPPYPSSTAASTRHRLLLPLLLPHECPRLRRRPNRLPLPPAAGGANAASPPRPPLSATSAGPPLPADLLLTPSSVARDPPASNSGRRRRALHPQP